MNKAQLIFNFNIGYYWSQYSFKALIFLSLLLVNTSCSFLREYLPKPPSSGPKTKLIKSNTENYGVRFPASTPMLNRINLAPNKFNHHITHNTLRDGAYTMMHWKEHNNLSKTKITDIVKATDYNRHCYYNNIDHFTFGKWPNAAKVESKTKIISEKTELIKDVKVRFVVSQGVYVITKASNIMDQSWVGEITNRIFLHAFIEQPNYLIEIFQPSGSIDAYNSTISTERASNRITEFIEDYLALN